jgi:hypothetical protein
VSYERSHKPGHVSRYEGHQGPEGCPDNDASGATDRQEHGTSVLPGVWLETQRVPMQGNHMSAVHQSERVLAQLRKSPVTIADFDRQPACDGGARITRLAARILDLKQRGLPIESRMVRLGDTHVKEYWLSDLVEDVPEAETEQAGLFVLPSVPHYREEEAA